MGIIENALADFVVNHFEEKFEEVEELKDELRNLQTSVKDLEGKVDKLLDEDQGEQTVQEKEASGDEEETEQKRVSSKTLKTIRNRFDLTQQELADLLEVSSGSITSWETGKSKPSKSNKAKIVALREKSKEDVEEMLNREEEAEESSAEEIRQIRKKCGLTQKQFAEKLDVSPTTVYNWEKGETRPGSDKLARIYNLEKREEADEGSDETAHYSGEDVKQLREEKGLTQSELAEEVGVSAGTVSNWERGESSPGPSATEKLREL